MSNAHDIGSGAPEQQPSNRVIPGSEPKGKPRRPARTRVWFEGGRLVTNNPAAFAASFFIPAQRPTDDGRILVSEDDYRDLADSETVFVPVARLGREGGAA